MGLESHCKGIPTLRVKGSKGLCVTGDTQPGGSPPKPLPRASLFSLCSPSPLLSLLFSQPPPPPPPGCLLLTSSPLFSITPCVSSSCRDCSSLRAMCPPLRQRGPTWEVRGRIRGWPGDGPCLGLQVQHSTDGTFHPHPPSGSPPRPPRKGHPPHLSSQAAPPSHHLQAPAVSWHSAGTRTGCE